MVLFLVLCLGYLLGSIPFAYLVTQLKTGTDIRSIGSGNVGATNVARALGIKWAIFVFLLDIAKGALFVVILGVIQPEWTSAQDVKQLVLLLPIIGHCYTIFLNFKGGKGVATTAGVVLVISPWVFLISLGTYVLGAKLTRHSFIGSFLALVVLLGLDLFVFHQFWEGTLLVLTGLIIFQHRSNIKKLSSRT